MNKLNKTKNLQTAPKGHKARAKTVQVKSNHHLMDLSDQDNDINEEESKEIEQQELSAEIKEKLMIQRIIPRKGYRSVMDITDKDLMKSIENLRGDITSFKDDSIATLTSNLERLIEWRSVVAAKFTNTAQDIYRISMFYRWESHVRRLIQAGKSMLMRWKLTPMMNPYGYQEYAFLRTWGLIAEWKNNSSRDSRLWIKEIHQQLLTPMAQQCMALSMQGFLSRTNGERPNTICRKWQSVCERWFLCDEFLEANEVVLSRKQREGLAAARAILRVESEQANVDLFNARFGEHQSNSEHEIDCMHEDLMFDLVWNDQGFGCEENIDQNEGFTSIASMDFGVKTVRELTALSRDGYTRILPVDQWADMMKSWARCTVKSKHDQFSRVPIIAEPKTRLDRSITAGLQVSSIWIDPIPKHSVDDEGDFVIQPTVTWDNPSTYDEIKFAAFDLPAERLRIKAMARASEAKSKRMRYKSDSNHSESMSDDSSDDKEHHMDDMDGDMDLVMRSNPRDSSILKRKPRTSSKDLAVDHADDMMATQDDHIVEDKQSAGSIIFSNHTLKLLSGYTAEEVKSWKTSALAAKAINPAVFKVANTIGIERQQELPSDLRIFLNCKDADNWHTWPLEKLIVAIEAVHGVLYKHNNLKCFLDTIRNDMKDIFEKFNSNDPATVNKTITNMRSLVDKYNDTNPENKPPLKQVWKEIESNIKAFGSKSLKACLNRAVLMKLHSSETHIQFDTAYVDDLKESIYNWTSQINNIENSGYTIVPKSTHSDTDSDSNNSRNASRKRRKTDHSKEKRKPNKKQKKRDRRDDKAKLRNSSDNEGA